MTATATVRYRTKLSNGSTRWTKTVTTVNSDNLPTQVDDLGDESYLPGDMLSATRTTYDADTNNWDTDLPVKGTVAKVEQIDSWNGSSPTWATGGRSKSDALDRITEATDAQPDLHHRLHTRDWRPGHRGDQYQPPEQQDLKRRLPC